MKANIRDIDNYAGRLLIKLLDRETQNTSYVYKRLSGTGRRFLAGDSPYLRVKP